MPITIAGAMFVHRLFHFRLPYSGWCHVEVGLPQFGGQVSGPHRFEFTGADELLLVI
jgi:hypothetical protein